jgi:hypothetical protein
VKQSTVKWITTLASLFCAGSVTAYDCSGLPQWKRQAYYLNGAEVQYQEKAYRNGGEPSKRDFPDAGEPWVFIEDCQPAGGDDDGDPVSPQPIYIYGAWHCSDDYCTWSAERDMGEFDAKNHWLIDRHPGTDDGCHYDDPGSCDPSVNLVILSFVHPLELLRGTTAKVKEGGLIDGCDPCGVPIGMNEAVVAYFKNQGIRVMLSIGGITYVDPWNQALVEDAWQLGIHAAAVAEELGVGIEIDYEENQNPDLDGLQAFINAYRSVHPFDPTGADHAARLTIDLAAGDRWLIALTERATDKWLRLDDPSTPDVQEQVLDYANAMVTPRQSSADAYMGHWQEHIDGKPQYDPPILPLAPAKLTGSLWLTGRRPEPECVDFANSLQHPSATGHFVQTITPNGAGASPGMLGFMFWAAECQGTRAACTTPEDRNTCEGGMGAAADHYDGDGSFLFPMRPLKQE